MKRAARRLWWFVALGGLLLLMILPAVAGGTFYMTLASEVLILAILAVSLDLLVGVAGLPSLGHGLFFGLGAYASAIVARHFTSDLLLGTAAGIVAALLVALVTGVLAVRTRGIYFLMLTLAFGQLGYALAVSWHPVTGGSDGLSMVSPTLFGSEISPYLFYVLVLALSVLSLAVVTTLARAPFGRTLRAARENEQRMKSLGYPVTRFYFAAFVISGAVAGLAGSLLAYNHRFVSSATTAFEVSALALVMVIVGGAGSVYGAALGAVLVFSLSEVLSARFDYWEMLLGLVFVGVVYFFPNGLAGLFSNRREALEMAGND